MARFDAIALGSSFIAKVSHIAKPKFGLKTHVTETVVFTKITPKTGRCVRPDHETAHSLRRYAKGDLMIVPPQMEVVDLGVMEAAGDQRRLLI